MGNAALKKLNKNLKMKSYSNGVLRVEEGRYKSLPTA